MILGMRWTRLGWVRGGLGRQGSRPMLKGEEILVEVRGERVGVWF